MASSPHDAGDEMFDEFLTARGHDVHPSSWEQDGRKKQCPECGGLHDMTATFCTVCGWDPH